MITMIFFATNFGIDLSFGIGFGSMLASLLHNIILFDRAFLGMIVNEMFDRF